MNVHTPFNTANYEATLEEAGLEKEVARAHRLALENAFEGVVTTADTDLMQSRIELAIQKQTADMQKAIADQLKYFLGSVIAIAGACLAIASLLFKLH